MRRFERTCLALVAGSLVLITPRFMRYEKVDLWIGIVLVAAGLAD